MAPKRPSPLENPLSASSSDDEEIVSGEEVEEEEAVDGVETEEEEEPEEEEETVRSTEVTVAPSQQVVKKPAVEDVPNMHKKASEPMHDAKVKKASSTRVTVVKSPVKSVPKREVEEKVVAAVKDGKKLKKSEIEVTEREEEKRRKKRQPEVTASEEKKPEKSETVASEGKKKKKRKQSETVEMDGEEEKPLEGSKKQGQEQGQGKGQGQRVFSEETEVDLLKGMVDFVDKNGKDFKADQDGFYEYVKKELDVEFSKVQLRTKVKNLKRKYKKIDEKVKNGEELKPLEQKVYELSSKIWGGGGGEVRIVSNGVSYVKNKLNGQRKRTKKEIIAVSENEEMPDETKEAGADDGFLLCLIELLNSNAGSGFGLNEWLIRRGWNLIGKEKRLKMKEQWESLLEDETKLKLRHLELARMQLQLVLDARRASSH